MEYHKRLSALLDWPLPYWLTPIGILILVGIWQGFSWKLNTENWPFWLWLLDKGLTAAIVIGAALYAQKVFNRNAILREDTDRRINGAIELSTEIKQHLEKCILQERDINKMKEVSNSILEAHSHIEAALEVHDLKIGGGLKDLMEARTKLNKLIIKGASLEKQHWPRVETIHFVGELRKVLEDGARKSLKSIRKDVTDLVKKLRKQQLSQPK